METKILVTGLWMGGFEDEFADCRICNYDYSWLFLTPSALIWSDKIILTPYIENTIENEIVPIENEVLAKTIKKTIEVARKHNLIEEKDPSGTITPKMMEEIDKEVTFDRNLLKELYPNQVRIGDDSKVPGQLFIEGQEYCHPFVRSIYASLILAREWSAKCLFQDRVLNYCKYKFGASLITDPYLGELPKAFETIFDSFLPEFEIFPEYTLMHFFSSTESCSICVKEKKCSTKYLNQLEDNLSKYLDIREYDEIIQIKRLISDIVHRLDLNEGKVDYNDVIREFKNEERTITKRIRSVFPKINRWSNLALIASIPITVVGITTGLPMVSAVGASIAGLSKATQEYVKYLESKYKWVGFVSKNIPTRKTKIQSLNPA